MNNQMKSGFVKIIECFNIPGIGLLTELQHNENGIPPDTEIVDLKTETKWIIAKRVLSGTLLIADSEIMFDCEIKSKHISNSFKTQKDREIAVEKELERRKHGIYWYLIKPIDKKQKVKPEIGTELKIKTTPQHGV
ncbi:hypothetical protein ACFFVF_02815 [Flavobacterium jumunjinense]|uniref:Uncharacterized protein n=2 Tax=Flavobacterium jumunjinense TaxID=998845 RepID=A0ABV5GJ72_9FLAO|nr:MULTISPECIES: hypothetical protein [Flavobacterium]